MFKQGGLTIRIIRVRLQVRDKDLLKILLKHGWKIKRISGSHYILSKDKSIETIPVHGRDIPIGLFNAIIKRTGLKKEDI